MDAETKKIVKLIKLVRYCDDIVKSKTETTDRRHIACDIGCAAEIILMEKVGDGTRSATGCSR